MDTKPNPILEQLRDLVAAATEPGLTASVRANRSRTVAEVTNDYRDALDAAAFVLPGRALDAFSPLNGSKERNELRRQVDVMRRDLADVTLPWRQGVIASAADTGTDPALQIVRSLARPLTIAVVPGLPSPDLAGTVDAADYSMAGQILLDDIADGQPHIAGAVFSTSHGFTDWLDPAGRALVDQIVDDVVTRAAELHMGNTIATDATPATSTTGTLGEQLDAAEGQASAGTGSVANVLLVNPADWPIVRRAVATSWAAGPHPTATLSAGIPVGTVITACTVALILEAGTVNFAQTDVPRTMGKHLLAYRSFRAIVRHAAGVVSTSL
jgi:hypothetical protein